MGKLTEKQVDRLIADRAAQGLPPYFAPDAAAALVEILRRVAQAERREMTL